MFQFRRFPTYAYLIQRTLHRYCPCGLPHSEIRASKDICSYTRLIAACHVLHRLLMPRHSPCALFSLTFVEETRSIPFPPSGENPISAPSFSSFTKNLRIFGELGDGEQLGKSLQRPFTEIAILMNYAGFTKKFFEIVLLPFILSDVVPQSNYASRSLERAPLCCLTSLSSHCSVFKVQFLQPLLKPDLKAQNPLDFEIQQQNAVFSWWAQVGSNHRPYDYQSYALAS